MRQASALLLLFLAACVRTAPPAGPSVAVVESARGASIVEEAPRGAGEEEGGEEAALDDVRPCKDGSFAQREAELAIDALGAKVYALDAGADPAPLAGELSELLEHPCLDLARSDPKDALDFGSAVSLRHWWREGGRDWLSAYVHLEAHRAVRIAPTPRVALTLETARKDHPLLPLLCPDDDAKPCGVETSGWARRANEKLSLLAERSHSAPDEGACAEEAAKEPRSERYASFRDCVEGAVPRERALPLGRTKAPSDGWLVLVGTRGSCRRVRAFDLVTGSTFEASECGPAGAGKPDLRAGRVPIGALREAAWMLMLAGESQRDVRFSRSFQVPEGFAIRRSGGERIGLGMISCMCGHAEEQSWSWMRAKGGALRGQVSGVVIGYGENDAERHALDLLEIAEDAFDPSCAPALPPAKIAWDAPGPASREGAKATLDAPPSADVRAALVAARPASRASSASRASRVCTARP